VERRRSSLRLYYPPHPPHTEKTIERTRIFARNSLLIESPFSKQVTSSSDALPTYFIQSFTSLSLCVTFSCPLLIYNQDRTGQDRTGQDKALHPSLLQASPTAIQCLYLHYTTPGLPTYYHAWAPSNISPRFVPSSLLFSSLLLSSPLRYTTLHKVSYHKDQRWTLQKERSILSKKKQIKNLCFSLVLLCDQLSISISPFSSPFPFQFLSSNTHKKKGKRRPKKRKKKAPNR